MAIPLLRADAHLPGGEHLASWTEVVETFGYNDRRTDLLAGLDRAISALKEVGATELLLNGSFATEKVLPNDYDACYVIDDQDLLKLPAGLDAASMVHPRKLMKATYLGDLFPAQAFAVMRPSPLSYREFF